MSVSGEPRPPLRAKDSDREAVVDVLNGAFVEGQLDPEEHQRRVDVALAAPTVGSLSVLTADLQLSAEVFRDLSANGLVPSAPATTPPVSAVSTPQPATRLVWAKGRLVALFVSILLLAGCLTLASGVTWQDGTGSDDSSSDESFEYFATVYDEAYLDDFVQAYTARFSTTKVVSVQSEEEGLRVVVPGVGTKRPTVYDYDGARFVRSPESSPAAKPTVDLSDLDTATIGALPDLAVEEMDIDDPQGIDLLIGQTDQGPGVQVTVHDDDGDTATMTTDINGGSISTSD